VVGERGARLALLLGLRPRVEQVQVTGTGVCGQENNAMSFETAVTQYEAVWSAFT